jgi:hypothetical protein
MARFTGMELLIFSCMEGVSSFCIHGWQKGLSALGGWYLRFKNQKKGVGCSVESVSKRRCGVYNEV